MKLTEICVHRVLPIGVAVLMAAGCLTSCRGSGAGGDTDTTTTTTSATTILSVNVSVDEQANATTTTPATKIVTVTKADGTVETKIVTEAITTTTTAKADKTTAKSSTTKSGAKQTTVSSKATTKTTAAPVVTTTKATTKATTAAPTTKATAAPTTKAPTTTKKITTTTTKATTTTTQKPTTTTTKVLTKCLNPDLDIWVDSPDGEGDYMACGKCAYCVSTRITPAEMEAWANAYLESLGMVIDYTATPDNAGFLAPEKWSYENDATVDLKKKVKQYIHTTIEWNGLVPGEPVRCVVREVDKFDCDYWIYILG